MTARGWLAGLTRAPRGMHAMMALQHEPVREEYLADLAEAVAAERAGPGGRAPALQATY